MTGKERMLHAYRGIYSDQIPAAPEFWFFYPAKVLKVTVAEFQREYPHWFGLKETFRQFGCEGWGIAGPSEHHPDLQLKTEYKKAGDKTYRETNKFICQKKEYFRTNIYSDNDPYWIETHPVKDEKDIDLYIETMLSPDTEFDFSEASNAHSKVGGDYLLEFDLGLSFFDYFEDMLGFEKAIYYFMSEEEERLKKYYDTYLQYKLKLVDAALLHTGFESYFIGCSSSCLALLGANLWRKWDKPYEKAVTDRIHAAGKLVHNHNHGKCMEIIPDFVEIGFDCVCPFERPPGDVSGLDGLKKVRRLLDNKVTFNGNVHTVEALMAEKPDLVREQVREIKKAFHGTPRLIIGTGDQVGGETPEDNIYAMIEEVRKNGDYTKSR